MAEVWKREDLLAELKYLRKDLGFTADRILSTPLVRQQLGGPAASFDLLRSRFVSAIGSLHDGERDLLLSAYRLTDETTEMLTLKTRRMMNARRFKCSVETIINRENVALQSFKTQLLTGWYPQSPLPVRIPEMHNGLIVESLSFGIRVEDRRWAGTLEEWRFTAVFDQADYLAISSTYASVAAVDGPDFTVQTALVGNSYSHRFYPRRPFERGRSYLLRYVLTPMPGHILDELIVMSSRAFHERTLRATCTVEFIGQAPDLIWQFSRLTYPEQPGLPVKHGVLKCDAQGSVHAAWEDLYGGLFSGIAWLWE